MPWAYSSTKAELIWTQQEEQSQIIGGGRNINGGVGSDQYRTVPTVCQIWFCVALQSYDLQERKIYYKREFCSIYAPAGVDCQGGGGGEGRDGKREGEEK